MPQQGNCQFVVRIPFVSSTEAILETAGRPPSVGTVPAALLAAAPVFQRSPDGVNENLLILLHGLGDAASAHSPLRTPHPSRIQVCLMPAPELQAG